MEFYADLIDKGAVLCVHLARNHPLPDGNKRAAYLATLDFLASNAIEWTPPSVDEPVAMIEGAAAGTSRRASSQAGSAAERSRPSSSSASKCARGGELRPSFQAV